MLYFLAINFPGRKIPWLGFQSLVNSSNRKFSRQYVTHHADWSVVVLVTRFFFFFFSHPPPRQYTTRRFFIPTRCYHPIWECVNINTPEINASLILRGGISWHATKATDSHLFPSNSFLILVLSILFDTIVVDGWMVAALNCCAARGWLPGRKTMNAIPWKYVLWSEMCWIIKT